MLHCQLSFLMILVLCVCQLRRRLVESLLYFNLYSNSRKPCEHALLEVGTAIRGVHVLLEICKI